MMTEYFSLDVDPQEHQMRHAEIQTILQTIGEGCKNEQIVATTNVYEHWNAISFPIEMSMHQSLDQVFTFLTEATLACGNQPDVEADETFPILEQCFLAVVRLSRFAYGCGGADKMQEQCGVFLEGINEVFDSVLANADVYEWVQPGSSQKLRVYMLQAICEAVGYDQLTGAHLMELTNNDVSGAVGWLSFVLKEKDGEPDQDFKLHDCAGRCLLHLTTADSVFCPDGSNMETEDPISKLTAALNRHVNLLITSIVQFDVVDSFGRAICHHQQNHAHTDVIIKHLLTTIHNCLLYCSQNQKKLRQHMALRSTIVQDIMIPYVENILPALLEDNNVTTQTLEWQNLKAALQTFCICTYNINVFRPQFRDSDVLIRIMEVPLMKENLSMLELVMKLSVNVDFATANSHNLEQFRIILEDAVANLEEDKRHRLTKRIHQTEVVHAWPMAKSNTASFDVIAQILPCYDNVGASAAVEEEEDDDDSDDDDVQQSNKGSNSGQIKTDRDSLVKRKRNKGRNRRGRGKGRRGNARRREGNLLGVQYGDNQDEDEDEDDDGGEEADAAPAQLDQPCAPQVVPREFLCSLSQQVMTDPMVTPDGYNLDRTALENWFQSHPGTHPVTHQPLTMDQCQSAPAIQEAISGWQMGMLAHERVVDAPQGVASPSPQPAPNPAVGSTAAVGCAPGSLLGDLPTLETAQAKEAKKKRSINIGNRNKLTNAPAEFKCAIDGKIMLTPLVSPYGHYFEAKTLQKWFASCGSVCPVTNNPLRPEDCQKDKDLKNRIIDWVEANHNNCYSEATH